MPTSLRNTIARIFADIRARRNIDSYVVAAVAIIIAVVGLIGDVVPESVKTSVILAALGLLVYNVTRPQEVKAGIEDYLHQRGELGPLSDRLRGAQKLWIYAPSAANILSADNLNVIRSSILNDPHGELRVLIQNPDSKQALALLVNQLDKMVGFPDQDLVREIDNTLARFTRIAGWPKSGKFEYGLVDYSPGFSMVVVDPHRPSGVLIVELYGWRLQSTADRMSIEIARAASDRWFDYWVKQYDALWADATRDGNPPVS